MKESDCERRIRIRSIAARREWRMAWTLGLMLACVLQPQQLRAATMLEELATLEAVHPLVRAGWENVEAAEYGVLGSIAGFLPKVTGRAGYGYERTRLATSESYEDLWVNTGSASLNQNLFNGLRTYSGFRSAQKLEKLAVIALEGVRQSVLIEGINAYINVRRSFQVVRIARAEEETIKTQANLEGERVRKGAGISVDVMFAKARLQLAKDRRVAQEGALRNAASSYAQVFDHPPNVTEMTDPEDPKQLLPATLGDAIRTAVQMHPSMLAANTQVDQLR
jgi:adhesin transport system outer membrane protein